MAIPKRDFVVKLTGKELGLFVVLIVALTILYEGAVATDSPSAGGIFNLIVIVIILLAVLIYLGKKGTAGLHW